MFKLEKEIKEPIDDIGRHTLMIVGEKKSGKSSFSAQFEDSHLLEYEIGNASHIRCSYTDIHNWEEACSALVFLQNNPSFCKTIVQDDVPTAYDLCLDWVRKKQGKDPSDPSNFDVWRETSYYFNDFIRNFEALPMGRIYTAHVEIVEVELRKGKKVAQLQPSWSNQCRKILEKYIKMTGFILCNEENERVLQIRGDQFIKASNGFNEHFLLNGEQVSELSLGNSAKEGYENFLFAWNNFQSNGQNPKKAQVFEL